MDIILRYDSDKIRQCNLEDLVLLLLEIVELFTEDCFQFGIRSKNPSVGIDGMNDYQATYNKRW